MSIPPHPLSNRQEVPALALALDLFEGTEVQRGGSEESGWMLQFAAPVEIGVWYGAGQTLEKWRAGAEASWPGVTFEPEEEFALCGRPARRQSVFVPEQPPLEGGFALPGGGIEYRQTIVPAQAAVVCSFEQRGTPVLVSWKVGAARRQDYRAAEERFFRSVTCG